MISDTQVPLLLAYSRANEDVFEMILEPLLVSLPPYHHIQASELFLDRARPSLAYLSSRTCGIDIACLRARIRSACIAYTPVYSTYSGRRSSGSMLIPLHLQMCCKSLEVKHVPTPLELQIQAQGGTFDHNRTEPHSENDVDTHNLADWLVPFAVTVVCASLLLFTYPGVGLPDSYVTELLFL